jgi:hypothetical protein
MNGLILECSAMSRRGESMVMMQIHSVWVCATIDSSCSASQIGFGWYAARAIPTVRGAQG